MNKKIKKGALQINPATRAISIHGQVSASLDTGSQKLQSGYGNGDCLLLDLENLVFAVSDSTDRRPEAARQFLRRLAESLRNKDKPVDEGGWLAFVNELYSEQQYLDRATFSGVALRTVNGSKKAVILHGGDSIILIVNVNDRKIKFQTISNMNFVGRAKGIHAVESIPLEDENEIIIIGSDGIADVARLAGLSLEKMCIEATSRYSIDEVPHRIAHLLDSQKESLNHDDIGIIAFDPCVVKPVSGLCVLAGGTVPEEERIYARNLADGKINDGWISLMEDRDEKEMLKQTGIVNLFS